MDLCLEELIFQNLCSHAPRVWQRPDSHQFIPIFSENVVLLTPTWNHSKSPQHTHVHGCSRTYLLLQVLTVLLILCMRIRAQEQVTSWSCSQEPSPKKLLPSSRSVCADPRVSRLINIDGPTWHWGPGAGDSWGCCACSPNPYIKQVKYSQKIQLHCLGVCGCGWIHFY